MNIPKIIDQRKHRGWFWGTQSPRPHLFWFFTLGGAPWSLTLGSQFWGVDVGEPILGKLILEGRGTMGADRRFCDYGAVVPRAWLQLGTLAVRCLCALAPRTFGLCFLYYFLGFLVIFSRNRRQNPTTGGWNWIQNPTETNIFSSEKSEFFGLVSWAFWIFPDLSFPVQLNFLYFSPKMYIKI